LIEQLSMKHLEIEHTFSYVLKDNNIAL
jgi:hypothetical protein